MARRRASDNQAMDHNTSDAGGKVNIAAGNMNQTFNTIHPRALTAAEEAALAPKLESKLHARGVGKLAWGLAGQVINGPRQGLLSYSLNQAGIFYERNEAKRGSFE
jgi:hypothetical protein